MANQQIILTFVPLIANHCLLMKKQITNTVLMVRPVRFRMNEQTVVNNYFQEEIGFEERRNKPQSSARVRRSCG